MSTLQLLVPVRKFHLLLQIFGLIYVSKNFKPLKIVHSCLILLNVIIFLIAFGARMHSQQLFHCGIQDNNINKVTKYTEIFEFYLPLVIGFLALFKSIIYRNELREWYLTLKQIEIKYQNLGLNINEIAPAQHGIFYTWIAFISLESLVSFFLSLGNSRTFLGNILCWITEQYFVVVDATVLIQFSIYIYILSLGFQILNYELCALAKSLAHLDSNFNHNSITIKKLVNLSNIYDQLYDLTKVINKIFGLQLLVSLIFIYSMLVAHSYYCVLVLNHGKVHKYLIDFLTSLMWVIFLISQTSLMSYCTHKLGYQVSFL